jgi:hypothetical protein
LATSDGGQTFNFSENLIWTLIRTFIIEYDGLFLDWDLTGENLEKVSAIFAFVNHIVFNNDEYFGMVVGDEKRPEILRELKLRAYYRHHKEYFKKRLELNAGIPGKIYQQYITNAVTAILIDSYAHNVSAHALSTLAWWYLRRADLLHDEETDWEALLEHLKQDPFIDSQIVDEFHNTISERVAKRRAAELIPDHQGDQQQRVRLDSSVREIRPEDGRHIIRYPGSLARELAQLLRFLTEKGAFWSGVTRDVNVGGKVSSLYSMLWYDFINNPFYLGTIAKTEDIMHVKLRIVLYEPGLADEEPLRTAFHRKTFKPENDGIFAEVNLIDPRPSLHTRDAQTPHEKTLSTFVKKGKEFEHFREKLKDVKLFLPGGIVGRHAFYTMIENEIRNVKHYNHEELIRIRKEGLTLAIGVQLWSLRQNEKQEVYRISIWLDTPTRLVNDNNEHLIVRKWEALAGEIFDKKSYMPLLGGTYQDKVCAAFLLNSNFSQVQAGDRNPDRDNARDTGLHRRYYPWVRPACSALKGPEPYTHIDFKVSFNNPTKSKERKIEYGPYQYDTRTEETPILADNLPQIGLLKKIFYIWRGEHMLEWKPEFAAMAGTEASWDNPARYHIVYLSESLPAMQDERGQPLDPLHSLRRRDGVVRIARGTISAAGEKERYAEGYKLWLNTLLGSQPLYALRVMENGKPFYMLALQNDGGKLRFVEEDLENPPPEGSLNEAVLAALRKPENERFRREWPIAIEHKEDIAGTDGRPCIRYRNHGIYKSQFLPRQHARNSVDKPLMMELFETLATKVCIFDNRIHHRMRLDKAQRGEREYTDFLRDSLKLAIHKEHLPKDGNWLSVLSEGDRDFLQNCHFLVMHLSYIESILPAKIPHISAQDRSNVGLFLQKCIIPLVGQRDNFFFVVTTGRGRNEWWASLDEEAYKPYANFTLFRAVESLLTAIENSVSMKDDLELKYRIVKILYGS